MNKKLRPLTLKDIEEYEWVDVSAVGDEHPVWIRGVKKTHPPADGFVYKEVTRYKDAEMRWERVYTYED